MMRAMADEEGNANQRRSRRVELNLLVQYRFDTFDDFMSEYAADISEGGMFIETDEPRAVGEMIYLQFALRDGTRLIEGLGRVAWSSAAGSVRPGMGIEFVNMDGDSQDLVRTVVRDADDEVGK